MSKKIERFIGIKAKFLPITNKLKERISLKNLSNNKKCILDWYPGYDTIIEQFKFYYGDIIIGYIQEKKDIIILINPKDQKKIF